MKCPNCGSRKLKRKFNYPHGKKSKPQKILRCTRCGYIGKKNDAAITNQDETSRLLYLAKRRCL